MWHCFLSTKHFGDEYEDICLRITIKLITSREYFSYLIKSFVGPFAADLVSDDDARFVGEDDGSSDDEGMLYLPDLEKARG
ncbi:hypothetical protein D0Y65_046292 [Glycine soja]|uniref:Uncharacterized protein n=1 Tax=Glycine soja TaxID=3848 RepID=A0A445G8T8_GLYSO|nr:hypothetical protein D0Y65_046292 [Glycine soja]